MDAVKRNYTERLPKTMRLRTAHLNGKTSAAYRVADFLGIIQFLHSEELRKVAEQATGKRLLSDPGCQVICYEPEDFCGPHTDHHPEERHLRDGYVDLHIMLAEPGVASQLLVYERRRGLLNAVEEVGRGLGVAIYQLPFWHYTTPLRVRSNVQVARRWVLLASYEIDRKRTRRR